MPINQIVIKFKDGNLKKGTTNDFFPNKKTFHLSDMESKVEEINIDDAKAIFFVKDLDGNKHHDYAYDDNIPGGGKKVSVDFDDGENIVGFVLGYSHDRQGLLSPKHIKNSEI